MHEEKHIKGLNQIRAHYTEITKGLFKLCETHNLCPDEGKARAF